jgi:quercetin dioxygenase-like cupin family protein
MLSTDGASSLEDSMDIVSIETRATVRGPSEWFTGAVWLDRIAVGAEPSRLRATRVSFEPGARTAWHTHPLGQVLHILTGVGLVQCEGGPVCTVRAGDTVIFQPGERHWHGAAPEHGMVHLAIQESDPSGTDVVWQNHVTDSDYNRSAP